MEALNELTIDNTSVPIAEFEKMTAKDLRVAAHALSPHEARYLVDLYYQIQEFRKATANQIRSLGDGEPGTVIGGVFTTMETVEKKIAKALDYYTDVEKTGMGAWAKSQVGIGPVIAAGFLAHIDFNPWRCNQRDGKWCTEREPHEGCSRKELVTCAAIWRFAGLDPTSKWEKGKKRPWNAALKTLCWKLGESFVKTSTNEKAFYGKLYQQRKEIEQRSNLDGKLSDQARAALTSRNIGKSTDAHAWYAGCFTREAAETIAASTDKAKTMAKLKGEPGSGLPMLPPAHIHRRATRWTVKLFLSHYFDEGCRRVLKHEPPAPYSLQMLGHVHKIDAMN